MKEKILTAVSTLMIFIPWTILPLRTCSWALESPAAEIIIYSYAAFMVFSGIFTLLSYTTAGVKNIPFILQRYIRGSGSSVPGFQAEYRL